MARHCLKLRLRQPEEALTGDPDEQLMGALTPRKRSSIHAIAAEADVVMASSCVTPLSQST
jgi:hypothetical protein